MTITDTLSKVDVLLDALATDTSVSDADLAQAFLTIASRAQATQATLTEPIRHDQRRAMFAAFSDVFGSSSKEARKVFTRLALGRPANAPVSWADGGDRNGEGALTAREASKVLDTLAALERAL